MPGPLDFLYQPPTADESGRASELAPAPPSEGGGKPLDFLFKPQEKRSASEIVQRGEFAGRDWADTAAELKKAGYAAPDEIGAQYTQRQALRAEQAKQGQGVGTFEQAARHLIPFGSAIINNRREVANDEAVKRFQQGKATQDDIETIVAHQRRADADRQINSSQIGQLLSVPLAAPAVLGETIGAGKIIGLGGKALGLGKVAAPPLLAAANPTATRAAVNFAGRQALMTPLVPSLYVQKANELNAKEGRSANDVRGFAPAIGLGYAQMLVLGSLQKFGNSGSYADQIIQKGAIGVGEQALADTGVSAVDEFLPKAYQTGTKYGVLGNLARGEVGEGLKQATTQMLTFSYFAALHGKTPDHAAEAYRNALSAQFKAGMAPEAAAATVDMPRRVISDALQRNPELTRQEAKDAIDEVNKNLPRPMAAENIKYGYALADTLPKQKPEGPRIKAGSLLERRAKAAEEPPASSETKSEPVWDGTGPPVESLPKGPPEAPESPPVDPIDAMHPDDRADLAKSLGIKEKGLRDPKIVDMVRQFAEIANAERAGKSKPPAPAAPAEAPARSAGEENTPSRGEEAAPPPSTPTGEAMRKVFGDRLEDLTPALGQEGYSVPFGDRFLAVTPVEGKNAVDINFASQEGKVGELYNHEKGVKEGTVTLLRDIQKLAGELANRGVGIEYAAEDKRHALYSRALEKAGYTLVKSEKKAGAKLGTYEWSVKPPAEPAAPSRTFTPFEKTAPDAVSTLPTRVPPPVTAEHRPAPRVARENPDAVTAPEARLHKRIAETRYEDVPAVVRNRLEAIIPEMERYGHTAADLRERVRVIQGAAGIEGVEALVESFEARFSTKPVVDTMVQLAEENARRAQEEEDAAAEAIGNTESGVEAGNRRSADAAARLRKRVEDTLREADRVATEAANGRRTAKATQPSQPGRKAGSQLTPAGKVQKVADSIRDPDAKEVLEAAIHNFGNKGPRELASAIGRSVESSYLSHGAGHVEREVKPAAVRAAVRAIKALGAVEDGPKVGELTNYNSRYHETPASGREIGFTELAEVARRPLTLGGAVVMRGVLVPKGSRKSQAKEGETLLQYIRGYGGVDASSLSPGERAEWREAGLHMAFQSDKMAKGKNAVDTLAEHLIEEGYLQADPKKNPTDTLLEALKKGRVVNESHNDAEADLQRYWREQEEAARHEEAQRIADAEARHREAEADPGAEGVAFSTAPGTELLGGGASSETKVGKPGAFDIIAQQNKLFDVRNYVEKSVPYNKSALAVALREQEATVTSKIAAGDPLVNLEEHAHHLQKALGLPENPDGLPLVVARGAQAFYQPDGKGVPTRMGMVEGFAKWLRLRSTDGLTGLTHEQQVASQYFERWAAEKGLTKTFDQIRDLYRKYRGRPAAEQAAANVSATGKPVQADRTAAEVATSIGQKAEGLIVNDLSVLERLTRAARKLGHKIGIGEDPYTVYSQLMYADPARAGEFERDGVHTYVDGRKVVIGDSLAKITEGAKPEWLKPGANGEASRAGTYAVARHILGEEARGRTGLVSDVQLEQYRRAMAEFQNDKAFAGWAEEFAKRLTSAFNATRKALAGKDVHFLSGDEVKNWEAKYPDYIPTDRVMQDAGWKASQGARGESPKKITGERSGSGEQIVDPLISYKNRLRVTSAVMGEQMKRIAVEKLLKLPGMGGWGVAGEGTLTELGKHRAEVLESFGFSGEQLHDILKSMGAERAEEYFTSRPWPTDGTKPTWGLKNADGKLVNYRIGDKALYDLITGQQVEANALASWLRATANFLPIKFMTQAVKFGATSASLGFQFRNVPRDIYTFWSNTIDRTKANPRDLGDAYKRAFAFAWHQLTGHFGGGASTDALFKKFADHRGDELRQFDFDKSNPASAYGPDRGKVVQTAHTIWGVLKDTLRLAGAGELAPRFLEWKTRLEQTTGKTEAQLTAELEAAEKAAAEGKPIPDPIPFNLALDAMNHAAEVTTPFNRLGTVTREVNKITPFFGPAIAGLSKQLRNWKENPKGAAFALSGLLAARLIHWALFSDEDWYKELSANDRFNNFVVPTPAGLRRFPAPRGLEVAGGGFLTTVLEAAAKQNPDVKGYLKEAFQGVAPPLPVPPAAKVGYEIAKNENWMGSPIVPKREENTSAQQKLLEHQLPYAADQMTGGLLSERKVPKEAKDLIPYSEVRNARRSVDTFYERLKELEQGRQDARQKGVRYADEAEYHRLESAGKKITELSREIRGEKLVNGKVVKGTEPPEDKKVELRKRQVELARQVMQRQ